MNEVKKRNPFASLERFELRKAKENIRTKPGEKTEAEFKSYGIHCKKKNTERKFNPYDTLRLEREKEEAILEKRDRKIEKFINKSLPDILKE